MLNCLCFIFVSNRTIIIDGGDFSNGYLELTLNDNNHISALKNVKTGESIDLSLEFTEVLEKNSSLHKKHESVCDGTNVYTFVPDEGSKSLSPDIEVS